MGTRETGQRGEAVAARALEKVGYTIIERNWHCADGELDLVCHHRNELVFVEVRSRAHSADAALESITPRKRSQLIKLAQAYLDAHNLNDTPYRIDVVAIGFTANDITIIEDAVGWE
ncbi:MAG: YraN family protein [Anaerolineae bacterium]|nr:YraN family protein [Anaerolineae bacterium]